MPSQAVARDRPALMGGAPVRSRKWPDWPIHDDREEAAVLDVVRSGAWWRHARAQGVEMREEGTLSTVREFEARFAEWRGCRFGVCVANGTVSLEIALRAAGVEPGCEVIVPPYTFIATASAPLMVGAVPIFVDIEPDTYNLDPARVEEAITGRTRAIVPVHFGCQPCDMAALRSIAEKHGLVVIEDAAHAHGSSLEDVPCGALGDAASFSFQNSKPMASGEGGIITTNDSVIAERSASLMWAGRRPNEPWYCHYELASNARMTEFQGAILGVQLTRLEAQIQLRSAAAHELDRLLAPIEGITPLRIMPGTTSHTYHVYIFRYEPEGFSGLRKQRFVEALQAEGIDCLGGYIWPLYANPMFVEKQFMGGAYPLVPGVYDEPLDYSEFRERCPVAERAPSEAIWLTQSVLMGGPSEASDVATAIARVQRHASSLR